MTIYLYASETAPIRPFDMLSSRKEVFYSTWTRPLHIQKSKKNMTKLMYDIKVGQFVSQT
jgi:hypothetical protein